MRIGNVPSYSVLFNLEHLNDHGWTKEEWEITSKGRNYLTFK